MKTKTPPTITLTQETVEALSRATNMDEWLNIAKIHKVDWNTLPDEWLTAIVQGDVTELVHRMKRKPKLGKQPKAKKDV